MKPILAVTVTDHSCKKIDQIISRDTHKIFDFIKSNNSRECRYGFCVTDKGAHTHVGTYRNKQLLTESINDYLVNL